VMIDFPTLFLKWYQNMSRFVFRTCLDMIISVRARGHCESSHRSVRRWLGVERALFSVPDRDL